MSNASKNRSRWYNNAFNSFHVFNLNLIAVFSLKYNGLAVNKRTGYFRLLTLEKASNRLSALRLGATGNILKSHVLIMSILYIDSSAAILALSIFLTSLFVIVA